MKIHNAMAAIIERCNRKKILDEDILLTPLKRCLNLWDLILLGIGIMVGPALYVLTGTVVRTEAGAGTPFSYMIAGAVAMLSSLCYAEFGARVPKAGSAYTYTYVSIGELWAFLIGWNIILEYIVGTAAAARAFGASINSLTNGTLRDYMYEKGIYINANGFVAYPDFIALGIVLIVMLFAIRGAKMSASINNVLSVVNVLILIIVMIVCFTIGQTKYWTNPEFGGLAPFGIKGIVSGAATCFYGYIGFDSIAIAGEEAKNPSKTIPRALLITISFVAILNVIVSASLTLVLPYWEVDPSAPFTSIFEDRRMYWAITVVGIGAILGTLTSVIGDLFALPRTAYAMASDGLLFDFLGRVNATTQTPIWAILVLGILSGVLALILDVSILVEFLSIGTLLGFTIVAASVIILRYRPICDMQPALRPDFKLTSETIDSNNWDSKSDPKKLLPDDLKKQELNRIGNLKPQFKNTPCLNTASAGQAATMATWLMAVCMVVFVGVLAPAVQGHSAGIVVACFSSAGIIVCLCVMEMHFQNQALDTFQMPLVPWLPALSMFCNIGLMMNLQLSTWIRLIVWVILGLIIYFTRLSSSCSSDSSSGNKIEPKYGSTANTEDQNSTQEDKNQVKGN